jgi:hypothetical protein
MLGEGEIATEASDVSFWPQLMRAAAVVDILLREGDRRLFSRCGGGAKWLMTFMLNVAGKRPRTQ